MNLECTPTRQQKYATESREEHFDSIFRHCEPADDSVGRSCEISRSDDTFSRSRAYAKPIRMDDSIEPMSQSDDAEESTHDDAEETIRETPSKSTTARMYSTAGDIIDLSTTSSVRGVIYVIEPRGIRKMIAGVQHRIVKVGMSGCESGLTSSDSESRVSRRLRAGMTFVWHELDTLSVSYFESHREARRVEARLHRWLVSKGAVRPWSNGAKIGSEWFHVPESVFDELMDKLGRVDPSLTDTTPSKKLNSLRAAMSC